MKFLIVKDTDGTKAYINTKQISLIQGYIGEKDKEDYTAILMSGTLEPFYVKGNVEKVVSTVRLIDIGVISAGRNYDFEAVPKSKIIVDPVEEMLNYFK